MIVPISSVTFIRMSGCGRGSGRHGRPRRHVMLISDEIPVQEQETGQANVAKPAGQQAMGALAREIARALNTLRAEDLAQAPAAPVTKTGPLLLKRDSFRPIRMFLWEILRSC